MKLDCFMKFCQNYGLLRYLVKLSPQSPSMAHVAHRHMLLLYFHEVMYRQSGI
jgi:hypothetical protein